MGSVIRIVIIYKEAFWRKQNFSGEVTTNATPIAKDPVSFVIDYCDDATKTCALCVTITAERAAFWGARPEPERRTAILSRLGSLFGAPATTPICYLEYDWNNDPFYKGGSFGIYPPGRNLTYDLPSSFNNIHWAGTETADVWKGYLEGACQSGIRAGTNISEKMKSTKPIQIAPETATLIKERRIESQSIVVPAIVTVGNR